MNTFSKSALSLAAMLFAGSVLQASSIQYSVTFDPTKSSYGAIASALTSFSIITPKLLTADTNFTGTQAKVSSAPGPGATIPMFPVLSVDPKTGSIGVIFTSQAPNNNQSWTFTAYTSPLTGVGKYTFGNNSTVATAVPPYPVGNSLRGTLVISNVPATSTPEPAAWLLSGSGLLLFAFARRLKKHSV